MVRLPLALGLPRLDSIVIARIFGDYSQLEWSAKRLWTTIALRVVADQVR